MQLKWTDLANDDLDQVEAYVAQENSIVVAIDVVLKIIDTTEMMLSNHPAAGRLGRAKYTGTCAKQCSVYCYLSRVKDSAKN